MPWKSRRYPRRRNSLRLKGYDYRRAGAYFVTICTWNRICMFGDMIDGRMWLNRSGQTVETVWRALPNHYDGVVLGAFIVMPDHVHGIIVLTDDDGGSEAGLKSCGDPDQPAVGAGFKPAPTACPRTRHSLSEIVRGFKTFSARRINEMRDSPGVPVWQRNYYDHVIRDDVELDRIRRYIRTNPARWKIHLPTRLY